MRNIRTKNYDIYRMQNLSASFTIMYANYISLMIDEELIIYQHSNPAIFTVFYLYIKGLDLETANRCS